VADYQKLFNVRKQVEALTNNPWKFIHAPRTFIYINPEKMASNGHLFCKELIFNAQYTKRERRGGKRIRVRQPFLKGLYKYTFLKSPTA
jgi:hypothetical protein